MNLKQLEYFVRVAELGSFTWAAIALNIARPALSHQVRLLEVDGVSAAISSLRPATMTQQATLTLIAQTLVRLLDH